MRNFLRENSLGLVFGFLFLAAIAGQAIAGHYVFNHEELEHGGEAISFGAYITSSDFGQAVMENWQSEYLQFTLFMLGTVWFLQRGSPESKELDKAGTESDRDQKVGQHARGDSPAWARAGGLRLSLYSNSLLIVMAAIWIGSWFAQSVTGWNVYNGEQSDHGQETISWLSYIGSAEFWEQTLQNWQSEFLAVGSFAVLAIYLRQRGSPESKPVGAPHDATGIEG
jgi:hypothetical protein